MITEILGIKAENKTEAKSLMQLCLALSGFSYGYTFGAITKADEQGEYDVEVIFKGDKGVFTNNEKGNK